MFYYPTVTIERNWVIEHNQMQSNTIEPQSNPKIGVIFDWDSIAFNNRISIVRLHSIWFDWDRLAMSVIFFVPLCPSCLSKKVCAFWKKVCAFRKKICAFRKKFVPFGKASCLLKKVRDFWKSLWLLKKVRAFWK